MSPKYIQIIDKRASLRHNPIHNKNVARGLTIAVQRSLMVDYWRRAEEATVAIEACLENSEGENDPCGVYAILICWYRYVSAQAPNSSQTYMEKFRGDLQTLYQREEPQTPDIPLTTHVDLVQVNYDNPLEAEVEVSFRCQFPFNAGRPTHLRAENF